MPNLDDDAKRLAEAHYSVEPGVSEIFRITGSASPEDPEDDTVIFLEVNSNTIPVGIMPLGFGPSPAHGIHSSSVIVEVTPEEFEKILSHELPLPGTWEIGELMPRPAPVGQQ